jgi:hypothetical protein
LRDALARSIAETAAEILGRRSDERGGVPVSDEAIGAHLWFERGFRDHDALVILINLVRAKLDERAPPRPPLPRKPLQLSFDLGAAL